MSSAPEDDLLELNHFFDRSILPKRRRPQWKIKDPSFYSPFVFKNTLERIA